MLVALRAGVWSTGAVGGMSPQSVLDCLQHRPQLGATRVLLDQVDHPPQDRPLVATTLAPPGATLSDSLKPTTPKQGDADRYRRFRSLESFGDIGNRLAIRPQLKKRRSSFAVQSRFTAAPVLDLDQWTAATRCISPNHAVTVGTSGAAIRSGRVSAGRRAAALRIVSSIVSSDFSAK
jgi:hypothetical protein